MCNVQVIKQMKRIQKWSWRPRLESSPGLVEHLFFFSDDHHLLPLEDGSHLHGHGPLLTNHLVLDLGVPGVVQMWAEEHMTHDQSHQICSL